MLSVAVQCDIMTISDKREEKAAVVEDKNYIFVSYAHKDSDEVIPTIDALSNAGFRVWYDSGIEAGTEWPEYIEEHLENARVVLVFMTPATVQSRNCRNEINLALEMKKDVLVVYLEDTTLLKGMRLQLNSTQSLFRKNHQSNETFYQALMEAKILQCCRDGSRSGEYCNPVSKPAQQPQPMTSQPAPKPTYTPPVNTKTDTRSSSYRKSSGSSPWVTLLVKGVIAIGLLAALIGFVIYPNLIYPNMANDDLNTPQILQTYGGSYKASRVQGDGFITISSCDASGNIKGYLEFIVENTYGKYEISGKILEKKNNGDLTISINPGQWIVQPNGYTALESMEVKISDDYQSLRCTKYSMSWSAGENDEFAIQTPEDLSKLVGSSATYQLKNDIDMSGISFSPIEGFTGTLMGNGYSIKNLTIDASVSNVGLFSNLEGTVINLKIEDAEIVVSGRNENIGILCGTLTGEINNVSVSGNVTADKSSGVGGVCGLVSRNTSHILKDIVNNASVTGLSYVGGCFGKVKEEAQNSTQEQTLELLNLKNNGTVTAIEDYAGGITSYIDTSATGFFGSFAATVKDCENTGDVSGNYYVAGIVGFTIADAGSTIDGCTNAAAITAKAYTGCIAGATDQYVIKNCSNEGSTLTATGACLEEGKKYAYVGGIVGKGTCLEKCTNYIDIQYDGGGEFVGGIMGYCSIGPAVVGDALVADSVEACFKNLTNLGNITGNSYVGGITGGAKYFWTNGCTKLIASFEGMVNSGSVTATQDFAGGIAGYMAGDVGGFGGSMSWCFYDSRNEGAVTGAANVGGLFGGFRNGAADGNAYERNVVTIDGCDVTGAVNGGSQVGQLIGLDEIKK